MTTNLNVVEKHKDEYKSSFKNCPLQSKKYFCSYFENALSWCCLVVLSCNYLRLTVRTKYWAQVIFFGNSVPTRVTARRDYFHCPKVSKGVRSTHMTG